MRADTRRAISGFRRAAEAGRASADAYAARAATVPVRVSTGTGFIYYPKENLVRASVSSDCRAAELEAIAHGLERKHGQSSP